MTARRPGAPARSATAATTPVRSSATAVAPARRSTGRRRAPAARRAAEHARAEPLSGLGRLARRPRLRPRTEGERVEEGTRSFEGADGPMITATLVDGPLAGETIDIAIVEGRPP